MMMMMMMAERQQFSAVTVSLKSVFLKGFSKKNLKFGLLRFLVFFVKS